MVWVSSIEKLRNSQGRHTKLADRRPDEPTNVFTTPAFLKVYEAECKRKRTFIREGDLMRRSMGKIAAALRTPIADQRFRDLLLAEDLATLPRTLAIRILADGRDMAASSAVHRPVPGAVGSELVGGIAPEVVELFQNCYLPPKIFGVLRKLAPARQLEVAKLMVAMNRVTYNYAKMATALSSQTQLADSSSPERRFAGLTDAQLAALKRQFASLCNRFRNTTEQYGALALELVAAREYLKELINNVRVVRYLAQKFPEALSEFQRATEPNQPAG
ncbi:plasmid partitioning protein RepB C-terminal domain-containing protein [Mesorhizobium sp. Cs1299R1N3]|uniref:plasmid partitioning protein RepB C-terminal domain-containing protein n=1 Tax=Mesorhizobium sp. Cs1299R1N3 TaxID=3015173 RepID=UPI00301D6ABE